MQQQTISEVGNSITVCIYGQIISVCNIERIITRSPASAGIANRPLVFLGIFLIFGSNTPTWSVENQLHY